MLKTNPLVLRKFHGQRPHPTSLSPMSSKGIASGVHEATVILRDKLRESVPLPSRWCHAVIGPSPKKCFDRSWQNAFDSTHNWHRCPPWSKWIESPPKHLTSSTAVAILFHCPRLRVIQICCCHWCPLIRWLLIHARFSSCHCAIGNLYASKTPFNRGGRDGPGWAIAFEFEATCSALYTDFNCYSQKQHCDATNHFDSTHNWHRCPPWSKWIESPPKHLTSSTAVAILFHCPRLRVIQICCCHWCPLIRWLLIHARFSSCHCAIGNLYASKTHLHLWRTNQFDTIFRRDGRPASRAICWTNFHIRGRRAHRVCKSCLQASMLLHNWFHCFHRRCIHCNHPILDSQRSSWEVCKH